jgi:hypothetical protein
MRHMIHRSLLSMSLIMCSLFAATTAPRKHAIVQRHVDPRNGHSRFLAVVPLIGTGKKGDPIRPDYVPAPPAPGAKPDPNGIIGYTSQMADDHKHALVEFVARDRSAFKPLMADTRPDVKVFEKGKAKRADIEAEFKKWKKDFDLDNVHVRVP